MYLFKTCSYGELQENMILAKVKSSPMLNNCSYGFPSVTLNLCSVKIEFVLRAPRQGTLSDVRSTMIIALLLRDHDVRSQRHDCQSRRYSSTNITIFNKTVLERALYSHQRKYMQFELQCTYVYRHLRWPFKFEWWPVEWRKRRMADRQLKYACFHAWLTGLSSACKNKTHTVQWKHVYTHGGAALRSLRVDVTTSLFWIPLFTYMDIQCSRIVAYRSLCWERFGLRIVADPRIQIRVSQYGRWIKYV